MNIQTRLEGAIKTQQLIIRELCDKCYVAYSFEQTDTNCKAFCETLVTCYV